MPEVRVGPGHPLMCIKSGGCFCGCSTVSEGSMYFCEDVGVDRFGHYMFCDISNCACMTVFVRDKEHGFCANRFRPLDPNDTSLVADEEEEDDLPVIRVKENENV